MTDSSYAAAVLARARAGAAWIIAAAIILATLVSFAESYRGLYDWFAAHGFGWGWAGVGPLMVDVFLVLGEGALFLLTLPWPGRTFTWRDRWPAWVVTICGLAASVAGNIGHSWGTGRAFSSSAWTMGSDAVPPLALAAALWVGLGLLKKLLAPPAAPAAAEIPDMPRPRLPVSGREAGKGPGQPTQRRPRHAVRTVPADLAALEEQARAKIRESLTAGVTPSGRSIADILGGETKRKRAANLIRDELEAWSVAPSVRERAVRERAALNGAPK